MLRTARQWGELPEDAPDPCANIVMNPRRPVARYLTHEELERLGIHRCVLCRAPLLTLTGARLSEVLNLRWEEIGELSEDGASARLQTPRPGREPCGSDRKR